MTNTADQNCAILLEQCSAVLKGFESNDAQTGRKYNIFKIANINEKEVIMCRVLADLLDPKGLHNQGDIYL
ncbi:MAG: PD-(D/E)XK nuclease family protein, partial [Treponema sp.]|nr:PD-(D/E)XK nuclease family protein [Treponema sp.]